MSCVRIYFLVLFAFFGIAVQFADCKELDCNVERAPGSDKMVLSPLEKMLRLTLNGIGKGFDKISDVTDGIGKGIEKGIGKGIDKISDISKGIGKGIDIGKGIGKGLLDKIKPNAPKTSNNALMTSYDKILNKVKFAAIFPGTLWCGAGNVSTDNESLGWFKKTDVCCKKHDECQNNIAAGSVHLNLKNNGIYTRSSCACDREFYDCLLNGKNIISNKVGFTYFNVLSPQCFTCACPKESCKLNDGTDCKDHCDTYQWSKSPKYPLINLPF